MFARLNGALAAAAACAAGLTALLGGWDVLLRALVVLMAVDYVGGVLYAIRTKRLSSRIGLKGITKKVGYLLLVIVACEVDRIVGAGAPFARTAVLLFLIANEGLSLLEHLGQLGVPIPPWLIQRLQKLREEQMTLPPGPAGAGQAG